MSNDLIPPKKQTLAEIASEAMAIEEILLQQGGELSAELEYWLQQVETNLAEKADHYKFAMDRFNSTAKLLKEKAQEFSTAAKSLENLSEKLKSRIKEVMLATGRNEIHGRDYRFKLSPTLPKMIIREGELSDAYRKSIIVQEIDKELIKEEISKGHQIAGVTIEPNHALRISINKE